MAYEKRDIPWTKIIRFHQEIIRRADEAFFALPVVKSDSERWSSIVDFTPTSLSGPWHIQQTDIRSQTLSRLIRNGNHGELFLGGICRLNQRRNANGSYSSHWEPTIYREVRVEFDSDNGFEIIPEKGAWDVSPLVLDFMDRKEIKTSEPLESLLPILIETACTKSEKDGIDLSNCLAENFGKIVPELGHELTKKNPTDKTGTPLSQWVLFAPQTTTSVFTQNLMRDYDTLLEQLEHDPHNIGGLKLLEDLPTTKDIQVDILPIVPLNNSQRKAVIGILKSKPVTVISGPPGCGKSQVVISLLLNAWANRTSVLFASTNNQAVDVVRERLERFENEFPVAIRAGSKKVNNIEESLRRILNTISFVTNSNRTKRDSLTVKRDKILAEKKINQDFLEGKLPQRVNQTLGSALKAYGQYRNEVNLLDKEYKNQVKAVKELGYKIIPDDFEAQITTPLKLWLERIKTYNEKIRYESNERSSLHDQVINSANLRNKIVQKVGLDPTSIDNWNWLMSGPGPELVENWLSKYRILLSKPLEQYLASIEWDDAFDEWGNRTDSHNWSIAGQQLIEDINNASDKYQLPLSDIIDQRDRFDVQHKTIKNIGISDDIQIEPHFISDWIDAYSTKYSLTNGHFDWAPWSQRSKLNRKLKLVEAQIRPHISSSVWREIGEMNEIGRDSLSGILEEILKWIAIRNQWSETEKTTQLIKECFNDLRDQATILGIKSIPEDIDISDWRKLTKSIENKVNIADRASTAWNKKDLAKKTISCIQKITSDFRSIASGIPIKERWIEGLGYDFAQSIKNLGDNCTQANLMIARESLYSASIVEFIDIWKNARDCETAIGENTCSAEKIPSEQSRTAEWWNEAPSVIVVRKTEHKILPDDDDDLWKHMEACETRDASWTSYCNQMLPSIEKRRDEELNWANGALRDALEMVPNRHPDQPKIEQMVKPLISGPEMVWPTKELQTVFSPFSPDRIKGRIDAIDAQLEELSFKVAKDEWLNHLGDDIETQTALDSLLIHYRKNYGKIRDSFHGSFEKVLPSAPIWITTAQSSQSIPVEPEIFDLLVIDEATQCTLTNILPMIYRAKRIAVIGDPEQLPAIGTIGNAAEMSLAAKFGIVDWLDSLGHAKNDVFKAAVHCLPRRRADIISLVEHYRSHPQIIGFVNQHVYQKRLYLRKGSEQTKKTPLGGGMHTQQVNGSCKRGSRGRSWVNIPEVDAVCKLVDELRNYTDFNPFTIGIVTPFSAQANKISEKLDSMELMREVTIGTAHKFQGDERDVMIFSPVVAKGITDAAARWVETPHNLINVALTRAKEALFIVGDLSYCGQQPGILGKLVKYGKTISDLRDTSPCELKLFSLMVEQGWDPQVHVQVGDIEVDFILKHHGIRLVIEADGEEYHNNISKDEARDAYLRGQGYKVLRIKCRSIFETPSAVIHSIAESLELDWEEDTID